MDELAERIKGRLALRKSCIVFENEIVRCWPLSKSRAEIDRENEIRLNTGLQAGYHVAKSQLHFPQAKQFWKQSLEWLAARINTAGKDSEWLQREI